MDPEADWEPDQDPLPLQAVAFWLLHVRVALCPGMTALGTNEILTTAGAAGGVNTTEETEPRPHPARARERNARYAMTTNQEVREEMGKRIGSSYLNEPGEGSSLIKENLNQSD